MSAARPARPASSTLSIGEVLTTLRPDFPDVTISKIRFLESEGLVEPERAPSGYRRFSHDDIARLRYVLTAQRDNYLPLRVIKEQLAQLDGRAELTDDGPAVRLAAPHLAHDQGSDEVRLSRSSLLEAAAITNELLSELESYGLITSPKAVFTAEDVVIARIAGELAEHGLEPRHLRTIRSAALRESDLVEQLVAPVLRQRSADARGRAAEAAREIGQLTVRLHTVLVEVRIRQIGG